MYNFSVHLKVISTDYFTGITQSRMNVFACQYIIYSLLSQTKRTFEKSILFPGELAKTCAP